MRSSLVISLATLTVLSLASCADSGPTGPTELVGDGLATVRIGLRQADGIVASAIGIALDRTGVAATLDPDTVASLTVRITAIQFLAADSTDGDATGWIALELEAPVLVDLTALPTEGDSPLVIASGSVPVGDYRNVRLFVDSTAVRFKGPVALQHGVGNGNGNGSSVTFDADTDYPVEIPSSLHSGIKTDAVFSVVEDDQGSVTDVGLLFSPASTLQNIHLTGNGRVMMAPVIRARPN